jgi:hypothetical protein
MLHAENILEAKMREILALALRAWKGYERLGLVEIARAADQAAFSVTFIPPENLDWACEWDILFGVAPALAAFLPLTGAKPGTGIPWMPSTEKSAAWTDALLRELGKVASLQRLAELERYGLARCEVVDEQNITMFVRHDDAERTDVDAANWLRTETKRRIAARVGDRNDQERIVELLDSTSGIREGWGIYYDGHEDLIALYNDRALVEVVGCSEAEALAHEAQIGGRLFAEWRGVCTTALGRVFNHLAYATRLKARHPELILRNIMTLAALKKDIAEVWVELGEQPGRVSETISHLTLDATSIGAWQKHHEIPTPFYIDAGGDWLLLPMFGGLLNPVCGLTRTLRYRHARDWDAAVDLRESYFRADLQSLFGRPRYVVPNHGFVLRRPDGSHVTDVDAAIRDTKDGTLVLVQLKWPDIFGRSTRERESRRLNLLKTNEWVERTSTWINDRTSSEVCKALGIEGTDSPKPPILMVLSRYMVHYTRNELDARAAWLSWPHLVRLCKDGDHAETTLAEIAEAGAVDVPILPSRERSNAIYEFPDLTVRVVVG